MATPTITRFELTGSDGGPLRGEVRSAGPSDGRPAVVICHGFKGFKDWGFFPHLGHRLAKTGLTAVSFNFSGSGVGADLQRFSEPERFGHMTVTNDLGDLGRVCERLGAGDLIPGLVAPHALGLFGHSRGGATAILFAARHPEVGALVTWAATASTLRWEADTVADWRAEGKLDVVNTRTGEILPLYTDLLDDIAAHRDEYDVLRAAEGLRARWLIVHGDRDEAVDVGDAQKLHQVTRNRDVRLSVIAGGGHTFGARHPWAGSTPELDQAMDATVDWFVRWLV